MPEDTDRDPENGEQSDLSPEDEQALDEVWKKIDKQGLPPPSKFLKYAGPSRKQQDQEPSDTPDFSRS